MGPTTIFSPIFQGTNQGVKPFPWPTVRLAKTRAGNLPEGMFLVYCSKKTVERLTRRVSGFYECLSIYSNICESSICSSDV